MATASSSLLLASPSPLSIQFQSSSSHLSFSRSQNLHSPVTISSLPSLSASSSSISSLSPTTPSVYCGRGDRKTAKGKRFSHSFGNARPRSKKNGRGPPRIYAPPDLTKKDKLEDKEAIKIDIEE